jgi:hypothetical protein
MVVQESLCMGVVRFALQLKEMPEKLPRQIAEMMFDLLSLRDIFVLRNTICGIRCLGEYGLCHNELLSDEFLERVAGIVVRHHDDKILVENCLAVLAVFSYDDASHNGLAVDSVMSVLFRAASTSQENITTRSLVATTLCNISVDEKVRARMVDKDVVDVLSNLSGATSELIQELCAKCICNITASVDLHPKILKHGILQTILMISCVRAVANTTKQLCARALLNLLEDSNIEALKVAGAVRVFATLSAIDNLPIQNICARAFLIFTGTETMREDIVSRMPVIHAIFGMVRCSSLRVNVMVGLAICNLLVCPKSQKMAIVAGGLSVLKIIAAMEIDELTEATARVIVNLVLEPSLHLNLLRETLVPVLVSYLQHPSRTAFECALHALSCMAQYELFHTMMIERGTVTALVGALMAARYPYITTRHNAVEMCRCLCLLSYNATSTANTERANAQASKDFVPGGLQLNVPQHHASRFNASEAMIVQGNIMLAPHIIYRNGTCTAQAATMMAILFRNLSYDRTMFKAIMEHDVLRLLRCLYADFKQECAGILRASIIFMNNLAHDHTMHTALLQQGMMAILHAVVQTAAEYGSTRRQTHGHHFGHHHGKGHGHSMSHGAHGHAASHSSHGSSHDSHASHRSGHHGGSVLASPHKDSMLVSPRGGQPQAHAILSKSLSLRAAHLHNTEVLDDTIPDERFDPYHTKYLILTKKDVYFMARTLNLVSTSSTCHEAIVKDGNAVSICDHLLADEDTCMAHSKHEVAAALCALSSSKSCRQMLVDQSASELLVNLARSAEIRETQRICGLALGYLSEISMISADVVGTVLLLNLTHEESTESSANAGDATDRDEPVEPSPVPGTPSKLGTGRHVQISGLSAAASAVMGNGPPGTPQRAQLQHQHSQQHLPSSPSRQQQQQQQSDLSSQSSGASGSGSAAASAASGQKTLRSMIKEGLLHRKELHSTSLDGNTGRSTGRSDDGILTLRDQVPELASQQELKITPVEAKFLTGHYNVYKFGNIKLKSAAQPAGMANKNHLIAANGVGAAQLLSPSLPSQNDRNIEPPDRLEELRVLIRSWTYIKEPLAKDLSELGEYFGDEEDAAAADTDVDHSSHNSSANSLANSSFYGGNKRGSSNNLAAHLGHGSHSSHGASGHNLHAGRGKGPNARAAAAGGRGVPSHGVTGQGGLSHGSSHGVSHGTSSHFESEPPSPAPGGSSSLANLLKKAKKQNAGASSTHSTSSTSSF